MTYWINYVKVLWNSRTIDWVSVNQTGDLLSNLQLYYLNISASLTVSMTGRWYNPLTSGFFCPQTGWMMWNWLVSALAVGASVVLYDGSPLMPTASVLWNLTDQLGWVSQTGTKATLINVSIHCLFKGLNGWERVKMLIVNIWGVLAKSKVCLGNLAFVIWTVAVHTRAELSQEHLCWLPRVF